MIVAEPVLLRDTLTGRIHRGQMLPGGFFETREGWSDQLERVEALPPDPPVESLCRECFFDIDKPTLNTRGDAP